MRTHWLHVLWIVFGSTLHAATRDQDWKIEPALLTGLDSAARSLAKAAREEELADLLEVLRALGMPEDKCARLQQSCAAECEKARAKPSPAAATDAAKRMKSAAKQLLGALPQQPEAARPALAEIVLRLDDTHAEAHRLVGNEQVGAEWLTGDERRCRARRAQIDTALRQVRRLEIPIAVGASQHPLLIETCGAPGIQLVWRNLTVHTTWTAEKATRALREALRGVALSSFLQGGALEPRAPEQPQVWLWLGSQKHYASYVDTAAARGRLKPVLATGVREMDAFHHVDEGLCVVGGMTESKVAATLLTYFSPGLHGVQASLRAGHMNWVSKAVFGVPIPALAWIEIKETRSGAAGQTRLESEAERVEREEALRLAEAGLVGCRSYMAFLARRHEDPPWRATMLENFGEIRGPELLKATSVIEFVQELSLLAPLVAATAGGDFAQHEAAYAKGVGEPLGKFEARWRTWILGPRRGLVQQLGLTTQPIAPDAAAALAYLDALRAAALGAARLPLRPVQLDVELSAGARLHALYLNRNPEQLRAWPDAHEEYFDRPGFTSAGAWAGANSVIAPGCRDPRQALEAWMGTFYHRLPLLDPGLMRIGWGFDNGVAVLDSNSLCAPMDYRWQVAWPYDGMIDVPTRFVPELPNPVPGADQREFGYPITLQVGRQELEFEGLEIELQLFDGDTPVDCHVSTPARPSNVEIAPKGAHCLIPKQPLRAGRIYRVEARWVGAARAMKWTFST
jgi:hypothetical protein